MNNFIKKFMTKIKTILSKIKELWIKLTELWDKLLIKLFGERKHTPINTEKEYLDLFKNVSSNAGESSDSIPNITEQDIKKNELMALRALKIAHEIRKFEIDLYWKRAAYFWTFIAVIFTGFFAISNINDKIDNKNFLLMTSCALGVIFSASWYCVNRGSKYWFKNWEKHIDMLEDKYTGPLYKTKIMKGGRWYHFFLFNSEFPFSVTKINTMTSFVILIVWIILLFNQANLIGIIPKRLNGIVKFLQNINPSEALLWIPIVYIILLYIFGRTGNINYRLEFRNPSKTGFKTRVQIF